MLSRKASCAGMASAMAGLDRGRVRERLQGALAGLQELHLLRERHSDMVGWALRMDREKPATALHADPEGASAMCAEEQRLEATLATLKQQLSRLRKQDVGLKTHLQQLDQQISELRMDVSKASSEQLESDSRPSSGFYELSDGGSCSRSNSYTSVYSECLSSSQTSLIPKSPTNCYISPAPKADVCRRRSADESTNQSNPPRATGLHLGSSRIRTSAAGTEQKRPRPVSTGDLDRLMPQGLGSFRSMDAKKSSVGATERTLTMEPKFQRNLETLCGTEVYQYPSPLHAVALQSPIFFHGYEDTTFGPLEVRGDSLNGHFDCDIKTHGYIDKVLQRNFSRMQCQIGTETLETQGSLQRMLCKNGNTCNDITPKPMTSQKKSIPQDVHCWYSSPVTMKEYSSDDTYSTLKKNDKPQVSNKSYQKCLDEPELKLQDFQGLNQRPGIVQSSSAEESQGFDVHSGHSGSPEFVHAKFVPAGHQRVKVRQADRKTKAVKGKRRSSEKPRGVRQQNGISERSRDVSAGAKGEKRTGKGKGIERVNSFQSQDNRHGSGSDSSPYSPRLSITHKIHSKPQSIAAPRNLSKNCRPQGFVYDTEQRKRRNANWQTDVNIFQPNCVQRQGSVELFPQASGNMLMIPNIVAKPGQWMVSPHAFQISMSSNDYLSSLNARYPPAPFHMSNRYPPKCESEYSAECASLFHSTIAESSEGEMSDNTTNCFGDSESSQSFQSFSDSDSSLSLDEGSQVDVHKGEGGLVWAEAALGPTAAGRVLRQTPPRPESSSCRIKASRALKKKIRRFQPASLKVMTLV